MKRQTRYFAITSYSTLIPGISGTAFDDGHDNVDSAATAGQRQHVELLQRPHAKPVTYVYEAGPRGGLRTRWSLEAAKVRGGWVWRLQPRGRGWV